MKSLDDSEIRKELLIHARAVGIPSGAANAFIDLIIKDARASFKSKSLITESDLRRAVVKEIKKYNADFAYVYEFHDKIV